MRAPDLSTRTTRVPPVPTSRPRNIRTPKGRPAAVGPRPDVNRCSEPGPEYMLKGEIGKAEIVEARRRGRMEAL